MNDEAQYKWGKLQRNTPRGDQAAEDARVNGDGVPNAFSEAFGVRISETTTPEIYKLILGMREDAGDLATREAKEHYMRTRPFAFYNEMTCNPEQQQELSTMVLILPDIRLSDGLQLLYLQKSMLTDRTKY